MTKTADENMSGRAAHLLLTTQNYSPHGHDPNEAVVQEISRKYRQVVYKVKDPKQRARVVVADQPKRNATVSAEKIHASPATHQQIQQIEKIIRERLKKKNRTNLLLSRLSNKHRTSTESAPVAGTVLVGEPLQLARGDLVDHRRRAQAAIDAALNRGKKEMEAFLRPPDMLTAGAVAARLGVAANVIAQWDAAGKMIGLGNAAARRYPAWQIANNALLPGLERLTAAARGREWRLYELLSEPQPEFDGKTGIDLIQNNDVDRIITILEGYGDGFA